MCGIAGRSTLTPMTEAQARRLGERLAAVQRSRGPDGAGVHHDADMLLVHRRLAILDLSSAGSQPLWNEDGTVCVIVNGEIYNFGALRSELAARGHRFRSRSDSEVLVHLYEEGGIERCTARCEGMFAYALWDARTRQLFLVRDRLGIKPLVIAEHADGITFGSTLAALLADPAVPREIRDEALQCILEWGFVPAPWSALAAARRVLPGTWLRIREGRVVEEHRWWTDAPPGEWTDVSTVRAAVADAVRSHLVADVPVGTLLSAGIDSGIVTALAAREADAGSLRVWSASQRGFPEDEFEEACVAARHFGVGIQEIPIGRAGFTEQRFDEMVAAMDEPLSDTSLIALHELFRSIGADRRVVLSGDGGDELFAGYSWHRGMPAVPSWARSRAFRRLAPVLASLAERGGSLGTVGQVAAHARRHPASVYLDKLRTATPSELEAMGLSPLASAPILRIAEEVWDRFADAPLLERMLAVERATSLPDQMLAKIETSAMAHSVESRVPLLADGVLAVSKGLPPDQKRRGETGKIVLREWFAELGPPGAAQRRKTGFNSPLHAWMSGPAGAMLRERSTNLTRALGGRAAAPPSLRLIFAGAVIDAWRERVAVTSSVTVGT